MNPIIATLTEHVRALERDIAKHQAREWKGGMATLARQVCARKQQQIMHLNYAIRLVEDDAARIASFDRWLQNPDGPQAG